MTANPLSAIPPMTAPPGPPQSPSGRFTPLDPLRVLRQYLVLLIVAATLGLCAGLGTYFYLLTTSPEYTSTARLRVKTPSPNPYAENDVAEIGVDAKKVSTFILNQIEVITSEELLSDAIKREDVRATNWYASFSEPREALVFLNENMNLYQVKGTTIFRIDLKVVGKEQRSDLAKVLNGIMLTYLRKYRSINDTQSNEFRAVFSQIRERMRAELEQINEEQLRFARDHDLPTLDLNNHETSREYQTVSSRLIDIKIALDASRNAYQDELKKRNSGYTGYSQTELLSVESDPTIVPIIAQIDSLKTAKEIMRQSDIGPEHPEMQRLATSLLVQESRLEREKRNLLSERSESTINSMQANVEILQSQLALTTQQFEGTRSKMQDLTDLLAQHKNITQRLDFIQKRIDRADEVLETVNIRTQRPDFERVFLMTSPSTPELTFPKFGGFVFGFTMIGIGLAAGFAFIKEMLDQRIKGPHDFKLIPDAEPLGIIPDTHEDPSKPDGIERIVRKDPQGLIAESYRQVRTSLLTRMDRRGYKTLMVVGAEGGVGISATVCNLAISFGINGRKVLLIDANFRRPRQHDIFDIPEGPGLSEILANKATRTEAVYSDEENQIDILQNGDGHSSAPEMLESAAFRNLLSQFETDYDIIIIDSPPALVTSESQLLAKRVDAIAVVVKAKNEKRGAISRMMRMLDGHRADLLGIILNGVRSSAGGYFRQSYKQYYKYHATPKVSTNRKEQDKRGRFAKLRKPDKVDIEDEQLSALMDEPLDITDADIIVKNHDE